MSKVKYLLITISLLYLSSCRKEEKLLMENKGYPTEIAAIIHKNCSTTGCHTTASKNAAGGISMSTWDELMEGGNNINAYVVPYSPDQSPLLYVINSYEELGPILSPKMPFNQPAFSRATVQILMDWINNGAPNEYGNIKFSSYQNRSMIYVLNGQCNLISVIDVETGLVMRYVDINEGGGEFAEIIKVAPNGEYYYVVHQSGIMKKFNISDNSKNAQLDLGTGFWRSMAISADSKKAFITDWSGNSALYGGQIALINLESMTPITVHNNPLDSIYFPFGITVNNDFSIAYSSCQTGNFIYKFDLTDLMNPIISKVILESGDNIGYTSSPYRPGNIILSSDESKYYVICEQSNEIRIYNSLDDQLIAINSTGTNPQNLVFSDKHGIYAVTCMEDQTTFTEGKGSVILFDALAHTEIKRIYPGYQPKGIVIDNTGDFLFIINRNADPIGADAPHHYSDCEGNNGYAVKIDLNTLELIEDYKPELNVNPYAVDIKY